MLAKLPFTKIANFSLRTWVMTIGILLSIVPAQFSGWLQAFDQKLFTLSSYLLEAPKGGANIGIVRVPDAELNSWQQDINSAGKLGALLANILHSSDATVGLILPESIELREGVADGLLQRIGASSTNSALAEEAEEIVVRKQLLIDTLRSKRVIVASHAGVQSGQKPLPRQADIFDGVPPMLMGWLWPIDELGRDRAALAPPPPRSSLEHYPLLGVSENERYLAVSDSENTAYGDFLAYYLFAVERRQGEASDTNPWSFYWQRDRGLTVGNNEVRTSVSGRLLTYHTATERLSPLLNSMSLEEGLARGKFPSHVLIASSSSAHVEAYAAAIYSLLNSKTAYTPWWFSPASATLTLLITLLLVIGLSRVSAAAGSAMVALILIILLVVQMVMAVNRGLWMPMGAQMAWLIVGFALIRIWQSQHQRWQHLQGRVDEAGVIQADMLINRGQYSEVPAILDDCSPNSAVLQKYYELGSAFAGKRQYRSAIDTFKHLAQRSKGFRDTEQKIGALEAMLASSGPSKTQVASAGDATVIIDQPEIDRPVLGRYEIRRELGRGAMGTVYLGYDPRIARQVAIKTLTYSQFAADQLDGIKSRFFREAEAAGRLNHPNIVSVYDVGEEADLAFIAMDYVEGKALSAFVNKNHLLPVFEVYRLMADVATALEYAHGSNIVHRDIKPGNIMYNPAPYQLKVTDFGIARLVDDSRTSTGEILGSPLYMSPEQLKGKRVNHAADVFSLGVTFYQLLTGGLPFIGDNLASLTYEIIHSKHRGVRTLRKELPTSASRITNQCLQKDIEDRYESAGELALVLKKAIKRDFAHEARKSGYL